MSSADKPTLNCFVNAETAILSASETAEGISIAIVARKSRLVWRRALIRLYSCTWCLRPPRRNDAPNKNSVLATIAADNAVFGQTGPRVGSFDGGYGATYLARIVGHKKAREIWYLCRQYSAQEALEMGLVNAVVPLDQLEDTTVQWAREILEKSMETLHRMANALLERETLDRDEVEMIAAGKSLPPRPPAVIAAPPQPERPPAGARAPGHGGPILGTPPAEPAGA